MYFRMYIGSGLHARRQETAPPFAASRASAMSGKDDPSGSAACVSCWSSRHLDLDEVGELACTHICVKARSEARGALVMMRGAGRPRKSDNRRRAHVAGPVVPRLSRGRRSIELRHHLTISSPTTFDFGSGAADGSSIVESRQSMSAAAEDEPATPRGSPHSPSPSKMVFFGAQRFRWSERPPSSDCRASSVASSARAPNGRTRPLGCRCKLVREASHATSLARAPATPLLNGFAPG